MARLDAIFAAGGILWRDGPDGKRLAVVHRPRHGDWVLPKGKLDPGEQWQDAALREVREETGYNAELGEFAGLVCYEILGIPKIVLFWNMEARGESTFVPGEEVDEVVWLTRADALRRLDHDDERRLLTEAPPAR